MLRSRFTEYMEPVSAGEESTSRPLPPPLYFLAGIAAIGLLNRLAPGPRVAPRAARGLGVLGILAGLGLGAWAAAEFRRRGASLLPADQPKALVTEGPFRFTRNPIYLGMAILLSGVGLLAGALVPLLVVPIFLGLLTSRVIRREEQGLSRTFGDAWEQYRAKVPRWL